jgi:Bacterial archaeo-eukaryotic release factor family 3
MNSTAIPEIQEVREAVHYRPAISIIMPFEPKMSLKTEITHALKIAADKVHRELEERFPGELGDLLMLKLRNIIANLNFNTHKKSIAIYVSPVFEKVLYLDLPVEEKIMVDESFEIRDLLYCKKQLHKYLVLQLQANESSMYIANGNSFMRMVFNTPPVLAEAERDAPERVANFSDPPAHKQVLLDKFLRHVDNVLDMVLAAWPLPLFVLGTEKVVGHFKKLTKHGASVIEYIHGNYSKAGEQELQAALAPHINDWQKVKQKDLLNQFEEAAGKNKLAVGIKEVWQAAMQHMGRLLVIEKNYMYAAQHGSEATVIYKAQQPYSKFSYIKDAVDDIIEKVLENGGDVEFVEEGRF